MTLAWNVTLFQVDMTEVSRRGRQDGLGGKETTISTSPYKRKPVDFNFMRRHRLHSSDEIAHAYNIH